MSSICDTHVALSNYRAVPAGEKEADATWHQPSSTETPLNIRIIAFADEHMNVRPLTPAPHFLTKSDGNDHTAQAETSIPLYNLKKNTICLLADDVAMNLQVLAVTLKRMGLKTLCANSGKEALELLEREDVDIVLTDLWMPEMSGVELTDHIRHSSAKKNIPIIAITADTSCQETLKMDSFNGVIFKPISINKLAKIFQVEK